MYTISRDGMCGIGFPLELLNVTQQGYGMPSREVFNPPSLSVVASAIEGVWRTHLESGKSTLLYSVADVASHVPEPMPRPGGTFYFWHSKYNRQGTRIMQVLRCIFPGFDGGSDRNAMVLTLSADGDDIQFTDHDPVWGYPLGGHPNWHPDGVHIIRNMKPDGKTTRICQFRYDGSDFRVLSESFQGKGHPSIEPGGRYVMTDHRVFHPDGSATTSLVLLDVQLDRTERICSVPTFNSGHLEGAIRALRVDGHPCWSRDYKKVSLQGTYKGNRQLYVVDMSEWIS